MKNFSEIRLRPKIASADFITKMKIARRLLSEDKIVKIVVLFRGRESTHPELGKELLEKAVDALSNISIPDWSIDVKTSNRMSVVLSPKGNGKNPIGTVIIS